MCVVSNAVSVCEGVGVCVRIDVDGFSRFAVFFCNMQFIHMFFDSTAMPNPVSPCVSESMSACC